MTIDSFRGKHRFLSNFYPCEVVYEGVKYPSAEHAYQAAKNPNEHYRELILAKQTPAEAKRLGRNTPLRANWNECRMLEMYKIVYDKFTRRHDLKVKLLATGDELLIEGNTWGDTYWGQVNGKGENRLGAILMGVREILRNEAQK